MNNESLKQTENREGLSEPGIWFRPDNSAAGFSLVDTRTHTTAFRLGAVLRERIQWKALKRAADLVIERFPYFRVRLRPGFFWYFWETSPDIKLIEAETVEFCRKFDIKNKLLRIIPYHNSLAVEFHHALTDGTGAVIFFLALIKEYFTQLGIDTRTWKSSFPYESKPQAEEWEDAYKKYSRKILKNSLQFSSKAFKLPFQPALPHLLFGSVDLTEIKRLAKGRNVSLTELMTAVYIHALTETQKCVSGKHAVKKPVRIIVPINLRNLFPSKTMRNFILFATPGIEPVLGDYSFEEIVNQVHHYLRKEINSKYMNQVMDINVRMQWNPLLRIVPLLLKKPVVRTIHAMQEKKQGSGMLSNLGMIDIPAEFHQHIKDFIFVPPAPINRTAATLLSFAGRLNICFHRTVRETMVETFFFRKLRQLGLRVKIKIGYS